MTRRRWLRRAAAWLLACALGFAAAGCGFKGPPKPPEEPVIRGL
ncbi:MAG: lipoprotein [Nitrospinota bacterium]